MRRFSDFTAGRSVKERIFIYYMMFFALLSVFTAAVNIINGLDFSFTYKWIIVCVSSLVFAALALKLKNVSVVHRVAAYFFVWIILPVSGFTSSGLVGPSLVYTFLLLIFVSYLLKGWERIFIDLSIILINLVITVAFIRFPDVFNAVDSRYQIFDWLVTVPVVSIFMVFLLIIFESAYEKERKLNMEKSERLRVMSFTDYLTGLYNRVHMEEKVLLVHNIYLRTGEPYAVLMIDIDFFKKYNDMYGHLAGDEVLKKFSSILKKRITRNTDWIFRYGGEEFLVLLGFSDIKAAEMVAMEIKGDLAKEKILHEASGINSYLTVSMGIASVDKTVRNPRDIIKFADEALYRSKEEGRNRISFHGAGE